MLLPPQKALLSTRTTLPPQNAAELLIVAGGVVFGVERCLNKPRKFETNLL